MERNYRMKILWSALLHRATIISTMQAFSHWLRFGGVIVNILWTTVWFVIN